MIYSCCDYSKILVIESTLGWGGGGQRASTILSKTKCNSLDQEMSLGSYSCWHKYVLFLKDLILPSSVQSFRGIPSTAPYPTPTASCLEISVAKGEGTPPFSGLVPCGRGTQVTQVTGPTPMAGVYALPITGSICVLWDTRKVGPQPSQS